MSSASLRIFLFILSFFLVSLGNPIYLSSLSFFAAAFGYALLWRALALLPSVKKRFSIAVLWYTLVQAVQLHWMTSREYQGIYILFVYAAIALAIGLQFGLLTLLVPREKEKIQEMKFPRMLGIASFWTLIEWSRLYFLCGFSFHPAGMALAGSIYSMQWAAIFGILGLSFWVILVNLAALKCLFVSVSWAQVKKIGVWLAIAAVPYLFGWGHIYYHERVRENHNVDQDFSVALVQTGLLPSEKVPLYGHLSDCVSPWLQWKAILSYLKEKDQSSWDLIVLPESAVPFRCSSPLYPLDEVKRIARNIFGESAEYCFPPLQKPYAQRKVLNGKEEWLVSNAFWAQAIANHYHAEVVIGLDEQDSDEKNYNAAFHFLPGQTLLNRYDKQVLVPLAEYLPFSWLQPLVKYYGITDFFTEGGSAKIFSGKIPLSVSICYEETFSDIIREGRKKGASLFVNVTNDNWYPGSLLPLHHFEQGRIRAVENGIPLVRSCNSGVTAVVDSLGKTVCQLGDKKDFYEDKGGVLSSALSLYQYKTLFTFWGDGGIVALSLIFFVGFVRFKKQFFW